MDAALRPLLWDQHCCLPLSPLADVGELARYARSGGSVVSANVGYAPHSYDHVLSLLHAFRRGVAADERLLLASTTRDIRTARDRARSDHTAHQIFISQAAGLDLVRHRLGPRQRWR